MNTFETSTLEKYKNILRVRNYSNRTIDAYSFYVLRFYNHMGKDAYSLTTKDVVDYLYSYKYSSLSQQNQIINALKTFYKYVFNKSDIHLSKIERPRKEKRLPVIIDHDFLIERINSITNLKHKAILSVAYSAGLRVSEVINLKVEDIDSKRGIINIRQAKGRKDRIVPLSDSILSLLRNYYKEYCPNVYLFNGQLSDTYTASSCNKLVKHYIGEDYHFHLLRHASFTSMLENGTDLRLIQRIAGHSSSKTTECYTHVSTRFLKTVKTPL